MYIKDLKSALAVIEAHSKKNTATPEAALKALQELGVVTAKGKIDKKYAQEPVLKKLGSK